MSIAVALLGMFGAIINDDIEPVKRAAAAGVMLGGHEFAALIVVLIKGWIIAHIFSITYFTVLWSRTNIWCTYPEEEVSWQMFNTYYHFSHIVHLHYLASGAVGSVICVLTNHNESLSYVVAAGAMVVFHIFSCYSPNQNQIKRDSVFFDRWDAAPMVELLCKVSYVRYFLKAMLLWDPDTEDKNGRQFVLRYFGFASEGSGLPFCCNMIFIWALVTHLFRFFIFSVWNGNTFHSLYDTPRLFYFLINVVACYVLALIIMILFQEWYFPWIENLKRRNRTKDGDHLD